MTTKQIEIKSTLGVVVVESDTPELKPKLVKALWLAKVGRGISATITDGLKTYRITTSRRSGRTRCRLIPTILIPETVGAA